MAPTPDGLPDYQTCMRPVLQALADGQQLHVSDLRDSVAELLGVSADARETLLPSGKQRTFDNRVGWAVTYLAKAECVARPARGYAVITDRGRQLLDSGEEVTTKRLEAFPAFQDFRARSDDTEDEEVGSTSPFVPPAPVNITADPVEAIEWGIAQINEVLTDDLLDTLKALTPTQFERVVIALLSKMGYGGSDPERTEQLGKSGDEGVDGVIHDDPLGLDLIYIQAKRYTENPIGRPDVQSFVGALHGKSATKGVFLTTTRFTREAIDYADGLASRVVLIDGPELAGLMIKHNVGVTTRDSKDIKVLSTDYFADL